MTTKPYKRYFKKNGFSFTRSPIFGKDRKECYMERWLLKTPWGMIRLHHILRSDADRDFHDHPFDFWTFLIGNGYNEEIQIGQRITGSWRKPWSIRKVCAETLHKIQLNNGPVWTLVLTGPKRREWGFNVNGTWVHWRAYHYGEVGIK